MGAGGDGAVPARRGGRLLGRLAAPPLSRGTPRMSEAYSRSWFSMTAVSLGIVREVVIHALSSVVQSAQLTSACHQEEGQG